MKISPLAILVLTLLVVSSGGAAEPSAGKIDAVKWLAGRWQSPAGERVAAEEHWSAPEGGAMVGMFRLVSGGRPGIYELLLLEEESDGVWMRLRHFRPQMVAQEQEPIAMKLASAAPDKLVFENPKDSRPKRVTYTLAGDELTTTIETERNGQPTTFSLKFVRVK